MEGKFQEVEFQSVGCTKATTSDTVYLWADLQSKPHLGRGQGCLQINSGWGPWDEWEQSPRRHGIAEWRVQAGAGGGGGNPRLWCWDSCRAKNIKGWFEYPPAFSSAWHLPPLVLPALFQWRVWSDDRGSDYWLLSVCHSSPFTSHRSCTFFWCKISCLGWPGVRPVPQMPLINLIARGSWGPVAQADKSPCPGRDRAAIWCVLLANVFWAALTEESSLWVLTLLIWKLWSDGCSWAKGIFFRVWDKKKSQGTLTNFFSVLASKMLQFFSLLVLPTSLCVVGKRNLVSAHCKHRPLHNSVVQSAIKQVLGRTGLTSSEICKIASCETSLKHCED